MEHPQQGTMYYDKNNVINVIIIIIILIFPLNLSAQISEDLSFIIKYNQINEFDQNQKSTSIYQETSEIKLLSLVLIRFYQTCISSQHDNKRICIFTPSCSRFSLGAIKEYGIFYGTLMTSDRIQRCNNFGKKHYHINFKSGKFHDPIHDYYFKVF